MQALTVIEYNGARWHDLHPLIAKFLIDQNIIPKEKKDDIHDAD